MLERFRLRRTLNALGKLGALVCWECSMRFGTIIWVDAGLEYPVPMKPGTARAFLADVERLERK